MSKYLTFDERLEIQKGLKYQMSFGEIAKSIGKDRTTVAKEIKRYSYEQKTGYSGYPYNACKHRKTCDRKNVCPLGCTKTSKYKCSICQLCNDVCDDFEEEVCSARFKSPYVCNGCSSTANVLLKSLFMTQRMHIVYVNHDCLKAGQVLCAMSLTWQESMH